MRLIERLNQGLRLGHKLTLISAPAGFGKTTLVSEWVESLGVNTAEDSQYKSRIAWLSLDENDNDLGRFLAYFVEALNQAAEPDSTIGDGPAGMLQNPQPPVEPVMISLINNVSANSENITLVLDDYHIIESAPVDAALTFLLEHLPPQLHLVIATRDDPNLPLSRLRARGVLSELRASDLRFTSSEASEFLKRTMGLNLSITNIDALESRTEGWIAGLQLAAISMQGHDDVARLISSFTGSHRYVLDYLIEEVLDRQQDRVQSFLLQTSVLERLTGSLCDAVTGQDNGRSTLEELDRANLFIVPLDNERRWYRYHHLFADLLNHRLSQTYPEQVPELHRRASGWYEEHDRQSDAIYHALAAQDFNRAADLAELAWPSMSGSFQSIAWLGWLKTLPDKYVKNRPVLCVSYAWACLNSGMLEAAEAKLVNAERWMKPSACIKTAEEGSLTKMIVVDKAQFLALPASLATARAYHAQAVGDMSRTVKYAQQVLNLLPEEENIRRQDASVLLGLAQWGSGDLVKAHQIISTGLAGMKPFDIIVGTFVLGDIKIALGQLDEAVRTYERSLQLALDQGESMPLGTEDLYTGIGDLHRERGDLEAAAAALRKAKTLGEKIELPDWRYRWCIASARLQQTLGDLDCALDLLDEAQRVYVRTPLPDLRPIAAMKARIWSAQGKIPEAMNWARERSLFVDGELSYLHEFEFMTLARILIARYRRDPLNGSIDEVLGLLDRLLQAAEVGRRMGSVLEILVLQAMAQQARDNIPFALIALHRAIRLAEPEGYFTLFVDEGLPMARLLVEAIDQGIMPLYAGKLLSAIENDELASESNSAPPSHKQLVEPLRPRELEVLQLIAEGLSNREIGERLFLALNTVKGHNRNIFGKLGVQRRTEAVARARKLGLF